MHPQEWNALLARFNTRLDFDFKNMEAREGRADVRFAALYSLIHNINRDPKKVKAISVEDVLGKRITNDEPKPINWLAVKGFLDAKIAEDEKRKRRK